ncbi:hypothetical protein FM037_17460 [Shewanella psychropiezotolerans]|uniref:Uncharacterized protein n=1 Tax=Shewanella psychropiezotolerans TaxID=2593655 RepID=A0ABX5X005_9GAMM|nr:MULTISPECIES: hypothetical protein [Shewanella]MPY21746.1 hypothetical protein [Shewanella sp. YLB-07]QDO84675.1 hypothetical protein FM037_17460 [Shewanella psychropiezotolerans]
MPSSVTRLVSIKNRRISQIKHSLIFPILCLAPLSVSAAPSEAEIIFSNEVIECASYYQISSDAIAAMNAPQMQVVGERLKSSSAKAISIAEEYQAKEDVADVLSNVQQKQLASLPDNKSLRGLMGKYKDSCKTLLAEPQKRLDYWIMATM